MVKDLLKFNARKLLTALSNQGLGDEPKLAAFLQHQLEHEELPFYSQALMGISAFIAAICFVVFTFLSGIIDNFNESNYLILGLVLIVAAILIQDITNIRHSNLHSFLQQFSLATMLSGKIAIIWSHVLPVVFHAESAWVITLWLLILTCLTYYLYRLPLERFLSTAAFLYSIFYNIIFHLDTSYSMNDDMIHSNKELFLNSFFFIQLIGVGSLFTYRKLKHTYLPIAYAGACSLAFMVLSLNSPNMFTEGLSPEHFEPLCMNLILAGSLIILYVLLAKELKEFKYEFFIIVSSGAILLAWLSAPGILLAINFMILGYAKQHRLLLTLGIILLPIFIFLYYANLYVNLLHKSGILLGSGLVLLAGRSYLQHRLGNPGGATCKER